MQRYHLRNVAIGIILSLAPLVLMADDYTPGDEFLQSIVMVRPGILDLGEMSVDEYVSRMESATLDDGSHPRVLRWERNGNRYNLQVKFVDQRVHFTFVHDLSESSDGEYSLLQPVQIAGEQIDALQFTMLIFGR